MEQIWREKEEFITRADGTGELPTLPFKKMPSFYPISWQHSLLHMPIANDRYLLQKGVVVLKLI